MKLFGLSLSTMLLFACGDKEDANNPAGEPTTQPSDEVVDADEDGIPADEDCDDSDASMPNEDADCDGVLTTDDCNDEDASDASFVGDCDQDGVPTVDDCDDGDSSLLAIANDADCDGAIDTEECDAGAGVDTDIDGDCDDDGAIAAADCDDNDASSTIVADDADCDGVLTAADCDDGDASDASLSGDCDQDGVATAADCDDGDSSLLAIADDADCDGAIDTEECDAGAGVDTDIDGDCDDDGTIADADCDDNDASSTIVADDADCDGVLTAADCDDGDDSDAAFSGDCDQDGVLTAADCDDSDSLLLAIADDADCDGAIDTEECDAGAGVDTDIDGDCDDDGTIGADDCDDNDASSTIVADDADCDGVLTAADCDDLDPASYPGATEIWYNGVDNDCSQNASDYDQDGDGEDSSEYGGNDCNDTDANSLNNTYYSDVDADGYGNPDLSLAITACELPATGYADNADDCDDGSDSATIVTEDGDCDGVLTIEDCDDGDNTDVGHWGDCDQDGIPVADDCDDYNAGSTESSLDGDCDGDFDNIQLSVGGLNSCIINDNQEIQCWGNDANGQSSPPAGSFKSLSVGLFHSCAIDTADELQCWGRDTDGQSTPPAGTFVSVGVSGNHSCAVDSSGTVQCWGLDSDGQVNDAVNLDSSKNYVSVSTGRYHSCALDDAGTIDCWGDDTYGQSSPSSQASFVSFSSGRFHNCAIDTTGGLYCWGDDTDGQVSNLPTTGVFTEISVAGSFSTGGHSCALDDAQTVHCWGNNAYNKATAPAGSFESVGAGGHHTCTIDTTGVLDCWGIDDGSSYDFGQLDFEDINVSCADPDDVDCDGTSFIDDCDDLDSSLRSIYEDGDCDGFLTADDCDDGDEFSYPGATEIWYNGVDNDCSQNASDYDQDGDGEDSSDYGGNDCDDTDANILNYTYYSDIDGDGYGDPDQNFAITACELPATGYADNDDDCNDDPSNGGAAVHPAATEVCDEIDNDCDNDIDDDDVNLDSSTGSEYFADLDGDGHGDSNNSELFCEMPSGYVDTDGDCDDADEFAFPGAAGMDDLLACMRDADDDDWGDTDVTGDVVAGTDCDDSVATTNPGVTDDGTSVEDGLDNNCNGFVDEDAFLDISALVAGDLIITEIMPDPAAVNDSEGEWFEIYNDTGVDLNLNGLGFMDDGSQDFLVSGNLYLLADGYLVFGKNADTSVNGGVEVDYEYGSGMGLTNTSDAIHMYTSADIIDSVAWDNGATFPNPTGASIALDPGTSAADNDDGANWCEGTSAYGDGDLGTPGAENEACPTLPPPLTWSADIQPILQSYSCINCHSSRMSSLSVILGVQAGDRSSSQAGANMPWITPNDPSQSYLLHKVSGTQASVGGGGGTMPQGGSMSQADIASIELWINQGAN